MASVQISLSDSLQHFVEEQAAQEGFPSANDYVIAVLRAIQERRARDEIDGLLQAGLATSLRRMTETDWKNLEESIRSRHPELSHG
jgi:antitoxin ParD1/3/4